MAAGDLCTASDVQTFLGKNQGQDEGLLDSLVTNASTLVNSLLNRALLTASYTETFSGRGGYAQGLTNYPVTAVASVTIDGQIIPAATPGGYDSGYLFDENIVYLRNYVFTRGVRNVTIAYTGGLAAVPNDLKQACVEMVANKYQRRTNLEVSGKTLDGETIHFTTSDIPPSAQKVINQYSRRFLTA